MKKFNHKIVYEEVCKKFDLGYGKESFYPNNYICFYKNNEKDSFFRIENIPQSKKYMKIAYVMFNEEEKINEEIYNYIIELYKQQRKNMGISMQIDNNSTFVSVMV